MHPRLVAQVKTNIGVDGTIPPIYFNMNIENQRNKFMRSSVPIGDQGDYVNLNEGKCYSAAPPGLVRVYEGC